MLLRRRVLIAMFTLAASAGLWPSVPRASAAADDLPSRFSDKAFWQLITDLSEAGGSFRSDNFLSNENAFRTVIPDLKATLPAGGVYLGVGPEQNFTYVVALRPKLAFIVDIRRGNLLEHLLYKAFIEMSSTRGEFLSRLFARKRPADLPANATIDQLFSAFENVSPSDELYKDNLQAAKDKLLKEHKFGLSDDDLKGIEYVYSAFFRGGIDVNYAFSPNGVSAFGGGFPSYRELMSETDGQGENRSYLATEENFRTLREYQRNNAIVPVVGDFGGDKALRAVGDYIRQHNATVTEFYTSNASSIVPGAYTWRRFCRTATCRSTRRARSIDFEPRLSIFAVPTNLPGRSRPRRLSHQRAGRHSTRVRFTATKTWWRCRNDAQRAVQIGSRLRIVRCELQRLAELRDRALDLARRRQRRSQEIASGRIARRELDGFPGVAFSAVGVALTQLRLRLRRERSGELCTRARI